MVEVLKVVAQYGGFPSIVALGLAWIAYKLWQHTNTQQTQMLELQNLRVAEAKEMGEELMKFSQRNSEVLNELTTIIGALKDTVQQMNSSINGLKDIIIMRKDGG